MEFIKHHKLLVAFIAIVLIVIIGTFILLRQFFVDTSKDEYGNRLDGIEEVAVEEKTKTKLKTEISALEEVEDITYREQGRLIYIEITFKEGVSLETAKEIASKTLEYFSDKQKSYYDIQAILTNKNEEAEGYPKIGYKHKTSEEFVW
jgi:preprotein translocase subunit SecF